MADLDSIIQSLQEERDRLDKAIGALTSLNGISPATATRTRGRKMSAAARARISAAQKARWAKTKTAGTSGKPKHHISEAGIARIRAAAKKRWAKVRAAKK